MREKLIEILLGWGGLSNCAEDMADHLIANGVTIPVRCKDCKHWVHMEDGMGDCTNNRFHLDGCPDPTMKADDFCCLGERGVENGT